MESLHDMSFISRPFNDIQLRMVIFYHKLTILMKNLMISDEHDKPWDFEVPMGSLKRQPEPAICYRGAAKKDSCLATWWIPKGTMELLVIREIIRDYPPKSIFWSSENA